VTKPSLYNLLKSDFEAQVTKMGIYKASCDFLCTQGHYHDSDVVLSMLAFCNQGTLILAVFVMNKLQTSLAAHIHQHIRLILNGLCKMSQSHETFL
jgi:hypothetical protein